MPLMLRAAIFFTVGPALLGAATGCTQEVKDPTAERSQITLAPPGEPGVPLVVTGTLRAADGSPIADARLRVFQADAGGRYTPERPMDEPNARLAGELVSGSQGRFEVHTVRPGGYAEPVTLRGAERYIPAHIHFEITADGFAERRLQLVFDDDPRMNHDYWREWAAKGHHPVAHVARDDAGVARCEVEIVLDGLSFDQN